MTLSLDDVNNMTMNDFVATFSHLFSPSTDDRAVTNFALVALSSAAGERPFDSREALVRALAKPFFFCETSEIARMMEGSLPLGNKRFSPRVEPELGTDHPSDDFELVTSLNQRYREKHGFTFVIRVVGRTKAEIIESLARRLENTTEDEIAIAARQYTEIIDWRVKCMVATEQQGRGKMKLKPNGCPCSDSDSHSDSVPDP
jgi:2-oxo-4-hydroxy-4-carboxy-5-ureidoimidazoline decarboxylase